MQERKSGLTIVIEHLNVQLFCFSCKFIIANYDSDATFTCKFGTYASMSLIELIVFIKLGYAKIREIQFNRNYDGEKYVLI